jgi:hypothetical protein
VKEQDEQHIYVALDGTILMCIVELCDSVRTQLENNEWIYFIPTHESIEILCSDRTPVDVTLTGIGKLAINANCKGYSKSAVLQTHSIVTVNSSIQAKDLKSGVNFEYECCEELGVKFNLSTVHLNTNYEHIVSHFNDLNIAGYMLDRTEEFRNSITSSEILGKLNSLIPELKVVEKFMINRIFHYTQSSCRK